MGIDPSKRYTAKIDTSMGEMVIALDAVKAPKTVNNFVFLALHHYYDGVIFHRIINGFMCQGGDPTAPAAAAPATASRTSCPGQADYQLEIGPRHGQRRPEHQRQPVLHHHRPRRRAPAAAYSLFGQVVKGLDVVETMQNVPTGVATAEAGRRHQLGHDHRRGLTRDGRLAVARTIVTGAGRGIGAAIARALDAAGPRVALVARSASSSRRRPTA